MPARFYVLIALVSQVFFCPSIVKAVEMERGTIGGATSPAAGPIDIVSSDPPDGMIDARQPHSVEDPGTSQGINSIILIFSGSTSELVPGDFSITENPPSGSPPLIINLNTMRNTAELELDRPITPGAFTSFTYNPIGTCTNIGSLPGDVNSNQVVGAADILSLIDSLNGVNPLPIYSTDIDRSGDLCGADILRVIDLANGAGPYAVWNGASLPAPSCP